MKTKNKISGYVIRSAVVALLFSSMFVGLTAALNVPSRSDDLGGVVKPATQSKALTFEGRVAYQRAIEEIYWRHRIWPEVNQRAKPSLKEMMSQAQIDNVATTASALDDIMQFLLNRRSMNGN